VLLAVFIVRTLLAQTIGAPRLADIFQTLIVAASVLVLLRDFRSLSRKDLLVAAGLGLFLAVQLPFATLFSPFPFYDLRIDMWSQGLIRGGSATVAALGGLIIARRGGPVQVRLAHGAWRKAGSSLVFGAVIGIPLAALNVFANAWVQDRTIQWQSPLAAAVDALQPALFEEVLYRLALLGLVWLVLQRTWPHNQAAWLAGLISLLVHTYGAHYSDEFIRQPLMTLAMGAVMGLIWGLPLTLLALRRDLDSATGFHWIQYFARFWGGL
jgi:hypothetical protein